MSRERPSATLFTAAFHREFQASEWRLLRRRFAWFCTLAGVLVLMTVVTGLVRLAGWVALEPGRSTSDTALNTILAALQGMVFLGSYAFARAKELDRIPLLTLTYWAVVGFGAIQFLAAVLIGHALGDPGELLGQIAFVHLLACLFLPWTPRQAIMPVLILAGIHALLVLSLGEGAFTERLLWAALAPLMGVPGVLVCWLKHNRRMAEVKLRFLSKRYSQVRRELVDARRIHEALLPRPILDGPVRFDFRYEPMSLIGGDFLHAHISPPRDGGDPALSVVVMDVTGHGIAAALTVNRLSGELERIFGENPYVAPGQVLRLLNRYAYLTLANHSVFLTACCLRVEPSAGTLTFASGGHPPAFTVAVDGAMEELDATTFILGACDDTGFDPGERTVPFGPGDAVIIYTDGAIECRNERGRMLGIDGLRRTIAASRRSPAGGWPQRLLDAVDAFRSGPPGDDTLIVEIARSLTPSPQTLQRVIRRATPVEGPAPLPTQT
ncbi:MAG: serine/threonine-protein phosphatase [Phycisphaeraceae bacterium]|nr:serine/threonine-protein phosphatase [Phycisphaeraceae bacterium]MCW5753266.1 serine/threonine-protein phosphatase [Phycisphaeraceae bacterium]